MSLRSRAFFNFRDIFEYFSRTQAGVILANNLRDVLAENGFYITERELQGLMFRLDRDQDTNVSFKDFVDEFTPKLH